ncbi:MAG: ABC transporter permease [Clostridium sp.]|jgi:NitT/TauT family transport system permease protein|uniref:ABC transporter permease n=1 Tax=Clostridium sp. TaxID=1506 RepID=UPI0025C49B0C|nr:ABC transporter permease [Clostridium sp.]MCH3962715.1 ABC transporter permease [Clostridium sp.]MCI1715870.1 ABC transporter permease [Clostridium sp.]MCI1799925.1 ABC transporter permease [Clostridium sp.]MCI1813839.1 ABC transporter permease [Clostridium sp.]MCI1870737.1 ABC transporter permease [Clostridium sp.]
MKQNTAPYLKIKRYIYHIISIAVFIVIWYIFVKFNLRKPLMFGNLPSPLEVLKSIKIVLVDKVFYMHVLYSSARVISGCILALPMGVIFGLLIGLTNFAKNFISPVFEMLRPIPQIAWIPIAILIFPSAEGSIIFITFLGAFFPILINTIAGTQQVNLSLIDAARSMNATRWQLIKYVYFSSSVPNIFTGLTLGVGNSWMSVIAAEMISGKYGIGYYTWTSYTLMQYPETIVGMITIGIIGTICFSAIKILQKNVLKWRK